MSVLVDTSAWSLYLRKRIPAESEVSDKVDRLIQDDRACLIGSIRQELLSGIRHPQQFNRLRAILDAYPDQQLFTTDYVRAAEMFNICRAQGVQGDHIDFLICAAAERLDMPILTTDKDFLHYRKSLPIRLYEVPD